MNLWHLCHHNCKLCGFHNSTTLELPYYILWKYVLKKYNVAIFSYGSRFFLNLPRLNTVHLRARLTYFFIANMTSKMHPTRKLSINKETNEVPPHVRWKAMARFILSEKQILVAAFYACIMNQFSFWSTDIFIWLIGRMFLQKVHWMWVKGENFFTLKPHKKRKTPSIVDTF